MSKISIKIDTMNEEQATYYFYDKKHMANYVAKVKRESLRAALDYFEAHIRKTGSYFISIMYKNGKMNGYHYEYPMQSRTYSALTMERENII